MAAAISTLTTIYSRTRTHTRSSTSTGTGTCAVSSIAAVSWCHGEAAEGPSERRVVAHIVLGRQRLQEVREADVVRQVRRLVVDAVALEHARATHFHQARDVHVQIVTPLGHECGVEAVQLQGRGRRQWHGRMHLASVSSTTSSDLS